jgi:hypothetical protein
MLTDCLCFQDSDFQTRSAAASALASITVDEAARQHAVKETSLLSVMPTICAVSTAQALYGCL